MPRRQVSKFNNVDTIDGNVMEHPKELRICRCKSRKQKFKKFQVIVGKNIYIQNNSGRNKYLRNKYEGKRELLIACPP